MTDLPIHGVCGWCGQPITRTRHSSTVPRYCHDRTGRPTCMVNGQRRNAKLATTTVSVPVPVSLPHPAASAADDTFAARLHQHADARREANRIARVYSLGLILEAGAQYLLDLDGHPDLEAARRLLLALIITLDPYARDPEDLLAAAIGVAATDLVMDPPNLDRLDALAALMADTERTPPRHLRLIPTKDTNRDY